MTVRELTPAEVAAHAAELLRIQLAAFRIEAEILGHDRIPYLYESVRDIMAPQLRWIVDLSEEAGRITEIRGAVVLAERQAGLFITRVIVSPDHHRRGVATRVLAHAQGIGQRLFVITSEDNPPGIGMYRKAGFDRVRDVETDTGSVLTEYAWEPTAD